MKNSLIALSATLLLSLSASAIAGEKKASVTVIDSDITQIQLGFEQEQDAIIGLVSDEYDGNATISINGSSITQAQSNYNNKQTARIGVIGCDCVEGHKGNRH